MRKGFLLLTGAFSVAILMALGWGLVTEDRSDAPVSGEPLVTVKLPELTRTAARGEVLFQENCAICHGDNAAGRDGIGPPLVHKIYEPGHHADGAFYLAAQQGVRAHHWPFGDMPPVDTVTLQDVERIIAYVRELQRANGIY